MKTKVIDNNRAVSIKSSTASNAKKSSISRKKRNNQIELDRETQDRITVLKGTDVEYNPKIHQGQETQTILRSKLPYRKPVKVLKGTATQYDSVLHQSQDTETIDYGAWLKRNANTKSITVLQGTAVKYDSVIHHDEAIETINQKEWDKRKYESKKRFIKVLKGTVTQYNPTIHNNQEIETITNSALTHRIWKSKKAPIKVLKGSHVEYDPSLHNEQETETISYGSWTQRKSLSKKKPIKVLKRSTVEYDPTIHKEQETETVSYGALYRRRYKSQNKDPKTSDGTTNIITASNNIPAHQIKADFIEQTPDDDNEKADSASVGDQPPAKRQKMNHFIDNNISDDESMDICESDPSTLLSLTSNQESTEKEIQKDLSWSDQPQRNTSIFGYRKVFFPPHQELSAPLSFNEQDPIIPGDVGTSLKKSDSFIFNIEEDYQSSSNLDFEIEDNFEFKVDYDF